MKKVLIVIPILIVVAAAAVLGLFAAGIIGNKGGEPVAQAITESAEELGFFGDLKEDAYFDILADKDPSTAMDNYVVIRDKKGDKVALRSTRLETGLYRITAREGFKKRSSYQIWIYAAEFAAEKYAGLTTFIFRTEGEEADTLVVKEDIERTERAGTQVELVTIGEDSFYNVILAYAAEKRFQEGDVILAQKPNEEDVDPDLAPLYEGDIEGYEYNGLAAYTVLRESQVVNGREEIFCRLSKLDEVIEEMDIYKKLEISEDTLTVNEEAIRDALENSDLFAAVVEAANETYEQEAVDLISFKGGLPAVTVRSEAPVVKAGVSWEVETDRIRLVCTISITFAKSATLILQFDNTITLEPVFDASCSFDTSGVDLDLNVGMKLRTETVFSIKMEVSDVNNIPKSFETFKQNLVKKENALDNKPVGGDIPFFSYNVPIWIFVLEFEIGMEMNFEIRAEIGFEYRYVTETEFGITFVNGSFDVYKSFTSKGTASDLVLLGHVRAECGVYVRFNVTCLKIVGVGVRASAGIYGDLDGQIRMEFMTEETEGNFIMGYYIAGGAYVSLKFHLKAGFSLPIIGFVGFKKDFEIKKWEFPLFEFGSKYLIRSADDQAIEIRGPNAKIPDINAVAYDITLLRDELNFPVSVNEFKFEYLDDAEKYLTFSPKDGLVFVKSSVGEEFTKKIKLIAKTNKEATCILTFHKDAVMPTCEKPELKYDVKDGGDLVFDVKLNQSDFIVLSGENITAANYTVDATGRLTMSGNFLSSLPMGEHTFIYSTSRGSIYLTVIVANSTPISVEKNTATFNKSAKANVTFKLSLSGNYVKSVSDLDKSDYYVDKSGTMVIFALGLMDQEVGEKTFVITSSNDTTALVKINVKDDRAPALYQDTYPFGKSAAVRKDVVVSFEKYGYTLSKVDGNGITASDYVIKGNEVTLKASFLSTLTAGEYLFALKFRSGNGETSRNVTVKVIENASLLAYNSYAVFDKDDPTDASFNVVSTGTLLLQGNGVASANYSYSGSTLTIKSTFLSTLPLGENVFVAKSGTESASLTVKVENNVTPQIVSDDAQTREGVLSLYYEKAKEKELYFEMILGGYPIKQVVSDGAPELQYAVKESAEKGTTRLTINPDFLKSINCGSYEYRIVTDVISMLFTLTVTNSAEPTPISQTSLSYTKGTKGDLTVKFVSNDKEIKKIECFGSNLANNAMASAIGMGEQWQWDSATETLTLVGGEYCYAEYLSAGYYKLVLYFGDPKEKNESKWTTVNIGLTVNERAAAYIPE